MALYISMRDELPDVESLKDVQWQTPMQIYSIDGKLISQFGEKKRIPLQLDEIPQQLINALLATEDDRFYFHFGVDPIGMARAVLGQLTGQNKGGASTITMQVARNFFLTREQTYIRKIKEIFLSFHIESLLTKDEILTLYINRIELGHRAFGFGAAAQVYYGKTVNELTLAQIAVLAGLPKAPSNLNPISSPARAQQRRTVVLQRMLVSGYITNEEYESANSAPITGAKHGSEIELNAPYVAEMAHQEMLERFGKEQAYTSGYRVFTTVSTTLQKAAQQSVINNLLAYDQRHGYRGAISNLRSETSNTELTSNLQNENREQSLVNNSAISQEEIDNAIAQTVSYQSLVPAVIVEVLEKTAIIALADGEEGIINWQGMSWARAYINDEKQGTAPKTAAEILTYGDVVLVIQNQDSSYQLSQLPDASAALVSISPDNGAIKAAVGGFSFQQSQFNRVTQAKRQVGSNIKPFIYSAALENGLSLATIVNDAPINQWDQSTGIVWRPKNSPDTYSGPIRVRLALAQSKNVVAVRLLREVGLTKMIEHLTKFGFSASDLPRNDSLALGSASLTPLEVVTGFATFANGGFLVSPYLIERIEDSEGNIIFQAEPSYACQPCDIQTMPQDLLANLPTNTPLEMAQSSTETERNSQNINEQLLDPFSVENKTIEQIYKSAPRVISEKNAFLITEALNSVIWGADWQIKPFWQGTGFRARQLKRRDIAGKTGTTNQSKDAWFSGFTRRLVTTSWIGFDDHQRNLGKTSYNNNLSANQTIGSEFGAKSAQPVWISFMEQALLELPNEPFEPPQGIISVRIDKATGKLTTKVDNTSLFEYFIAGTEPKEYVTTDKSSEILDGTETKKKTVEEIF